ncbi:IucA/IucC family protein [Alkalihalophilus lindianensis]|uniref:IucA/IucC family protein n=1 Tax=Alkalihalophilus lindianensis TaxID=1630542 RepID=A0ABU3XF81_9BACI|nr:IucA/IucC family protein [Alkalihalophilus lindianensis]MDV2686557.1 IucA/IucC family protein [Alkalihalophilus lindianensis]
MTSTAKRIAEEASFKAFLNSYLREVNAGQFINREELSSKSAENLLSEPYVLMLNIPHQSLRLAVEITYKSLVGRHSFGDVIIKYSGHSSVWKKEEKLAAMVILIQELHMDSKVKLGQNGELLLRIIDSYETMAHIIDQRMKEGQTLYRADQTFIEAEQSLLYGHWLHPTPKSRQGMPWWQHKTYSPEMCGKFQLHYFKVNRSYLLSCSEGSEDAIYLIHEELKKEYRDLSIDEDFPLIPMHPLQAQWLLEQPSIKKALKERIIVNVGLLGADFTATSSIRTVYNCTSKWMYKFSIPVKVTNSLRVNKTKELVAGKTMAKLVRELPLLKKYSAFKFIKDPAFLTVKLPGLKESGFEMIIRENPFRVGEDRGITTVAALVQDPLPGCQSKLYKLIKKLSVSESQDLATVSFNWFKKYVDKTLIPLMDLYDSYGIALEAHQQNSVIDVSTGYPETYFYRDNQGYYLSNLYKNRLIYMEPELVESPELFYREEVIQERFIYYLLMNHLFSIINRFGTDGLLAEEMLILYLKEQLVDLHDRCNGAGQRLVAKLLSEKRLAFKANLLTRFHDVDELTAKLEQAVYTTIENPFHSNSMRGEVLCATNTSIPI